MSTTTMPSTKPVEPEVHPVDRVQRGQYASVDAMMADLTKSPDDLAEFRRVAGDRALLDSLVAIRIKKGLSQKDIAQRMECTQSRISKLENGTDSNTTIGDFKAYAHAIGLDATLMLLRKHSKLADLVKTHTLMIRHAFDRLLEIAADDESMKEGTKKLAIEVTIENFKTMLNALDIQIETGEEKLQLPPMRGDFTSAIRRTDCELVYS
jgi:transcriptional regulator with XRE-family HTH domain